VETLAQRYGKALYPATHRVCGYRLRPFTLGHAFLFDRLLLHRLDSMLAGGTKLPSTGELRLAVAICQRTHAQAVRFVQSTWGAWWLRWGMLRVNFLNVHKGVFQFVEYRKAHSDCPEAWSNPENKSKPICSPPLQQVKLTLIGRMGYTEEQAMDTSLSRALFDHFCFWEMEGKMNLVGDEERSLTEDLKNEQSAIRKEMAEFTRTLKEKGSPNG